MSDERYSTIIEPLTIPLASRYLTTITEGSEQKKIFSMINLNF